MTFGRAPLRIRLNAGNVQQIGRCYDMKRQAISRLKRSVAGRSSVVYGRQSFATLTSVLLAIGYFGASSKPLPMCMPCLRTEPTPFSWNSFMLSVPTSKRYDRDFE